MKLFEQTKNIEKNILTYKTMKQKKNNYFTNLKIFNKT